MRIVFDDGPASACSTGIGRYARTLTHLLRHVPGHEVVPLSALGLDLASEEEAELELPAALQRERVDVFHSPLWRLPAALPCRAVVTVHDAIPAARPDLTSEAFAPLWRRALEECQRADAVVCPSEHSRRHVVDALGLDVERVHVIAETPDPVFSRRSSNEVSGALNALGVSEPYLLVVGTLERRKNPDGVLDALALLAPERRPSILFAGPPGGYDTPCEATRRGLGDRVRELGLVPDELLATLYSGALAALVCSRAEGFGLPVVEAWACGAPVIASNATALPEVAGQAALLVDPEDPRTIASAIDAVVQSSGLREELQEKGRARLETRYSAAQVRAAFAALYDSLVTEALA